MSDTKSEFKETDLNTESIVLWFDDLGSGNEEYRFLSNFYRGDAFYLPGVSWEAAKESMGLSHDEDNLSGSVMFPTGEHAFAAMKFWGSDYLHFRRIVASDPDNPNEGKALGRSRSNPLRTDWEIVKLDVMAAVLRSKFTLARDEGRRLLATGDRILVEGTFWYDEVWGVSLNVNGMPGRNWLGTLLMARRAELRAQSLFGEADVYTEHFANATGHYNTAFGMEGC